jgi:hypothetical protein
MSFLRRALGGDRPPDWASFMTGEEYRAFTAALEQEMTRRAWTGRIADGAMFVDAPAGAEPAVYGLSNLAQVCHQVERSAWPRTISMHFDNLLSAEAASDTLADYAVAEPLLKVRVYRPTELPPEAIAKMVTTPLAPDLIGVLVADLPTTVQTLGRELVSGWNVPIDQLFGIATQHMADEAATYDTSEVDLGGGAKARALSGESFFVGSQIIRFRELAGPLPQGALVVIPTRHILLWYPIGTAEATIRAVNTLIALGINLYGQGPGSLSPSLFWWHGALSILPASAEGGKVQFAPPDEFVELLNSLP